VLLAAFCLAAAPGHAQQSRRDRAMFVEPRNEFLDSVKSQARRFHESPRPTRKELRLDFSGIAAPSDVKEFTSVWHQAPVSQGLSGMCWCFSGTSFYESEIHRLTGRSLKLSELFTVYWEYVEKAKRFVRERGKSEFGQGSQANAVPQIWKQYGVVPAAAYTGMKPGQTVHDHDALFDEMKGFLASVKEQNAWNEDQVTGTIRAILDHHLGRPPETVVAGGKQLTPREYLAQVVRLDLDAYAGFLSIADQPYYTKIEYAVPDNWWHSADYHNIPLDVFMELVKKGIRGGFSVCLWGDVSEPGYEGHAGIGVVPTFDIPSAYIDEHARVLRFRNKTTTDDHGIHLVGVLQKDGRDWFLIKDSGSGSRNNAHPGYYFYEEDYVKLKILGFAVHRSVAEEILTRFPKETR
jgi:bleomycin hydrolase